MRSLEKVPAALLLADGTRYDGYAVGKIGTSAGEICFNTGTTGYQEVFTDPSYFGQILVETNVHIGNYGTLEADDESNKVQIAGLVCRNFNEKFSRPLASLSLQDYFVNQGLVGISEVDTRDIVMRIRAQGAMNAVISSESVDPLFLNEKLHETPDMAGLELSSLVSTHKAYDVGAPSAARRIAVLDYGVKQNTPQSLASRDCFVRVFPAKTPVSEMEAWAPDAYQLSNGPGDPAAMPYAVETARQILATGKPLFGICLGHQILSQAAGLTTYKMHHGHRGINHPVLNLETGRAEITSHNHGFGVDEASIQSVSNVKITHRNLNDNSIEGIRLTDAKAFSVQYHPESSPGPHDSRYLFDDFLRMIA